MEILLAIILVFAVIYIIPIIVYGFGQALAGLKLPAGANPQIFLISVFISKFGTAIAFVLLFYFARSTFSGNWLLYAAIWFSMFALGEAGQAIGPNYSWKEAVAGVISEAAYLPLSALVVNWLIKV